MSTPRPMISLIVAMAANRVIGRNNRLPWRLPEDLRHFKAITMGKPLVMGRKTWESLPGLLPGRRHIVLTAQSDYRAEGVELVHSLPEALAQAGAVEEVMIAGGEQLYRQALPIAQRLYLTRIEQAVEGDAHFPPLEPDEWELLQQERHRSAPPNSFDYTFETLVRRDSASAGA